METHQPGIEEDLARILARNVVQTRYQDLPPEAVSATKRSILDIIGTTIAASGVAMGCREIVELVQEGGGREESTILGFGGKVPCWMAAFANGAMAHSLDYDDTHDRAVQHPGIMTVPVALAVAERLGGVDGREFITAVALGQDLICRLGLATWGLAPKGWLRGMLFGYFGAAAVAGRLLGLDEERMVDAFGLAYTQASGNLEFVHVGGSLKGIYAAFPCKAGVLSALMAQKGITGAKASLEGEAGLLKLYLGGGYRRALVTEGLGKRFEGANLSFKPWPCCRYSHPFVEAVLGLRRELDMEPAQIQEVTVFVEERTQRLCEPLEIRRRPRMISEAQYSLPYTVATALVRGKVLIRHFTPEALQDPEVLRLAARVRPEHAPDLEGREGVSPGRVAIRTEDGLHVREIEFAYGHPRNPITQGDLVAKFRDCLSHSALPIPQGQVEEAIERWQHLEEEEPSRIVTLLS